MGISVPASVGLAPDDAEYVTGSSSPDLENEIVKSNGTDILVSGSFGTSSGISPGFGTWTQASADNPAVLTGVVECHTDGNSNGFIRLDIDESGGTSRDYRLPICIASKAAGSGFITTRAFTVVIPAGAQFRFVNFQDPAGENEIRATRTTIITP